jgi:hypothetical protein
MKNQLTVFTAIRAIVFLILAVTVASQTLFAQTDAYNNNPLQVKFVSGDNEYLVFDLKYDANGRDRYDLVIIDESNNEVLMKEELKGRDFDKTLRVPRLSETGIINFLLKSKRSKKQLSFYVNITERIREVAVQQ